jgi:hypothetical protein
VCGGEDLTLTVRKPCLSRGRMPMCSTSWVLTWQHVRRPIGTEGATGACQGNGALPRMPLVDWAGCALSADTRTLSHVREGETTYLVGEGVHPCRLGETGHSCSIVAIALSAASPAGGTLKAVLNSLTLLE